MPDTSSNKRKLTIALAILAIVVAVAVVFKLRQSPPADAAGMAQYLPKRESALLFIDMAAIRNAGVLEKVVGKAVGEEEEYRNFVAGTGFDYKRDLDRILMSSGQGIHHALLQGRFDVGKLKAYATQQGGRCDGDYCSLKGSTPGRVVSFHPISGGLLAFASGTTDQLARDIQKRESQPLPFAAPAQPIWLHMPGNVLQSAQDVPSGTKLFQKAMEKAESALFTLGPKAADFELSLDVTCPTEPDAAILKAQLEGITALLHKFLRRENQAPSANDLSGVLTSGNFQRQDRHVIGHWTIQKAFVDSLGGS